MVEHDGSQLQGEPGVAVGGRESGAGGELHHMDPYRQRETLTRLVGQGKNDEEIGREFGLSQWQIRNLRYKLGIKKDRGGNVYLHQPEIDLEAHAPDARRVERVAGRRDGEVVTAGRQGLSISWAATSRAEELASRLDGLGNLMRADLDNRLYDIRVEITER